MDSTNVTPLSKDPNQRFAQTIERVIDRGGSIIVGKNHELKLAFTCLIARGHLLIEDLPGVGKTTLAQVLAKLFDLDFNRVQFTSDMLPADILGVEIYNRDTGSFSFHPGPVFANVVLADEVNRATPRSQSALLEAMEERQVTIDNTTHRLPEPFFVIATQNPTEQVGTFPLPESQLDRFLMRISLGYPGREAERDLLQGVDRRKLLGELQPVVDRTTLLALQAEVDNVHASDALVAYVQDLIDRTRQSGDFVTGLSPRSGLALVRAAKAWALIDGRRHVLPDDVQEILPSVAAHRLLPSDQKHASDPYFLRDTLIRAVPIP
ncbi:MAG: MoxR family ATPase [Pseudomonadota bacterium]